MADALAGDARLAEARARLIDPQVDDTTKLAVVGQLLRQVRRLLLFDDFEQNLAPGGRDYHDLGFAEMIGILLDTADIGRVLVTSRYPPPNGEAYLQRIDLPPLSRSELGRLLLRLPALRELQPTDRLVLLATIGGHPRLIEFVDALLRHGRANLKEVTSRLRRLAGDHDISVTGRRPFTQAVEEACCSAAATSSSMSCWPCSTRRSGSRMTLYREIAAGRLAAIRIRDRLLIPRTALERLVEDAIEAAESGSGGGSDAA